MTPPLIAIPRELAACQHNALYRAVELADGHTKWEPLPAREFAANVETMALNLLRLGLGVQEAIGIFSENRVEMLISDFAAWQLRALPVAIYATSTAEQVRFIVNDASIRIIVVGSQAHYDTARAVGVAQIIAIDPAIQLQPDDVSTIRFAEALGQGAEVDEELRAELARRNGEASGSDLATLLYTSGTTGEPKGAMLSHDNFAAAFKANHLRLTMLQPGHTSLCFLPLSHIFELAWCCFCILHHLPVYVNTNTKRIQQSLREVNPNCMAAVPRFWEKVYTAVMEKIDGMSLVSRTMCRRAIAVGRKRNLDYVRLGKPVPAMLEREYQLYNGRIFRKLRRAVGADNGVLFPTAGAPISTHIVEFFRAVGIPIVVGYGLSETTATVSCFTATDYEPGSAGKVVAGLQLRIAQDSEIQLKGATIMSGYYNRPELTAQVFTPDGWFRTGDAGRMDRDGNLYITERLKDLFKTSNGKYIAPQAIESRLGSDPLFEQMAVIGDQRKFVSALIVPDYKALAKVAADLRLGELNREQLARNPRILEYVQAHIEKCLADLAPYERIKRFTLLTQPFSMDNGELTNTLKVKRRVVAEHYAALIDKMYEA